LLTYALGRGLERTDRRFVRDIAADVAQHDYKFSELVTMIVKSDPFEKRGAAPVAVPASKNLAATAQPDNPSSPGNL